MIVKFNKTELLYCKIADNQEPLQQEKYFWEINHRHDVSKTSADLYLLNSELEINYKPQNSRSFSISYKHIDTLTFEVDTEQKDRRDLEHIFSDALAFADAEIKRVVPALHHQYLQPVNIDIPRAAYEMMWNIINKNAYQTQAG